MNDQFKGPRHGDLLGPADDVFFGILVKIAVVKGLRVKGIEQLLQLAYVNFDGGFTAGGLGRGYIGHRLFSFGPDGHSIQLPSIPRAPVSGFRRYVGTAVAAVRCCLSNPSQIGRREL
jgi:hypothetical protein